ncbi:hypothetical protein FHETE_10776 [Fusarium heterosporum]|uniref:Uncharacterized protein n=1 Tax=Fusarium heterosporum TaxID=42747 RepID=A0A8H5SS93_FUSHE|nr:hypothetical protein FHETE_10776 [Fusarium heterosporum]
MELVKPLGPKLSINIHPKWVKQLRENMNICCSFGFSSSGSSQEFNVIAWARPPQEFLYIPFEETYCIAACEESIQPGDEVVPGTRSVPISIGQTVSVGEDWTMSTTDSPKGTAADAFRFQLKADADASAIISNAIHRVTQPVYIAGLGTLPMPCGTYTIKPTGKACLFFMGQQQKTAFSMDDVSIGCKIIQYAGNLPMTVSFSEYGTWIVS